MHCHGDHLERSGVRGPRSGRRAGGPELTVPGTDVRGPGLVLSVAVARLVAPTSNNHHGLTVGDRQISPDISGNTADGRISVPTVRREGQRARLVRVEVPASDQPVGAVRFVVHHRDSLCVARRPNHLPSLGRGTNRAAAAGLFRHHVGRGIPARRLPRSRVCAYHHAGVYRRGKQLRAGDRGGHRHLWCDLRSSSGRCGGAPHRGAGLSGIGVRLARAATAIRS
ncbi:Uncharacterised protein [Mycobacteroides abscessus subsp. massiliense]|nr:Uncharacterised protein [Mycobacteroides abscessus subsp. massiliense]